MKRMLVITPDPETTEVLTLRFELEGFDVIHCLTSAVGPEHFTAHEPQVCIIDIVGIKTGELEGTQEFLKQAPIDTTPVIILTPVVPDSKTYPTLHAYHILKKPYNLTTLVKMVLKTV